MLTLRDHCTHERLLAHSILDRVRPSAAAIQPRRRGGMSAFPRLRHFGTPEQRRAHEVLDRVKAGERVPAEEVRRALRTLGERA